MGKKGSWFSAVKKVLRQKAKEKEQKPDKSKRRWFGKHEDTDVISFLEQSPSEVTAQPPTIEDVGETEVENEQENEQESHGYSMAEETAVTAAQPAAEEAQPIIACPSGKLKEEIAAIKIQTAFRGHMARRALRALKGLARLKSMMQGQSVKQQVASTLNGLQTIARVQAEIRARRIRMSEENHALQRHIQQKRERELDKLRASIEEQWDESTQSKAQIQAKLLKKQEAATRRERALAYSFSHQQTWKNSKTATPTFMDPNDPHWGWSWLERWMAVRPWEAQNPTDSPDHVPVSEASSASIAKITKLYFSRDLNRHKKPSPRTPIHQKPSQLFNRQSSSSSSSGQKKIKLARSRSLISDDESRKSSPLVPSFQTPKKTGKAKSQLSSPSVKEKKAALESTCSSETEKKGTIRKVPAGSVKKRLSFTATPTQLRTRRHSSPPI